MSPFPGAPARWIRSPYFWILLAAAAMRVAGLFWGLPAADGWDDDGVAPRNFLVGIVQTYMPGSYFTYPPLHMFLLAILTAPGWILALANAPALNQHAIIAEMTQVPFMTFFSVVARTVSIVMSLGTIYLVGRIAEVIGGRRTGHFAAAVCALDAALTYYGQVTNLDGPCLFWSVLAVWLTMRTVCEHDIRHARWAILAAAAAVATKDQAFAVFLLSVPLLLAAWFAVDDWPKGNARRLIISLLGWSAVAVIGVLLIDGAITNPSGFAARIAFLTGPASTNYEQYTGDATGRLRLLADMWTNFPHYYPPIAAALAVLGLGVLVQKQRHDRTRLVAGLLPLLAAVSFTIAFDLVVLRSEPRFFLPQSVFLAVYVGIGADWLFFAPYSWARLPGRLLTVAAAMLAFYHCAGIVAAIVADPRYDAERWMAAHIRQGDTIETYGLNAYLPRFPAAATVSRVGLKPLKARNPLPDVKELLAAYGAVGLRHPQYIVVSGFWVRAYLAPASPDISGGAVPKVQLAASDDLGAKTYFRALFGQRLAYRVVHVSSYHPEFWPPVTAYESLAQSIFIFGRRSANRP